MPVYLDIHEIEGATPEAVAGAHLADVAIQDRYGVNYVKYWLNEGRGKIFCLCTAPSAEAAERVHREAHGLLAQRIIEVDPDLLEGFMGGSTVVSPGGAVLQGQSTRCDPGHRTILFTDIVESTAMTQRLGDRAAMAVVELHDRIVRGALGRHSGREVKHLGDGIMAAFSAALDAVRCAASIQSSLRDAATGSPHPLRLRIGVAAGDPLEREGDFFGSTVQLASRLCAHAQPQQTLVSSSVCELCAGVEFTDLGELVLKGFAHPTRAYAVT